MEQERTSHRPRLWRRPGQDAGVTLIEVVIAAVLLGILSTAVLGIILTTQSAQLGNRARVAASNLAAREIDMVRQEFLQTPTSPLAIAAQGTVTNKNPLEGGAVGQPLVVDGTPYTVTRAVAWNITGDGSSACDGGSLVVYPTMSVTVTVTWPAMGGVQPVTSSATLAPEKGNGIPGTDSFVAVEVLDAAGSPNPGRGVKVTGGSEVRTGLTDSSGCAVVQVSPAAGVTGTSYIAQLTDTGYVDISGTTMPSKSVGAVTQGQLKNNVSFSYDLGGTIILRLVDTAGVPIDPTTIYGTATLAASESSGTTNTTAVPLTGAPGNPTFPGRWPTLYGAYFGSTAPAAGYTPQLLTPGGSLTIDVPVVMATGSFDGMPAGTTRIYAVPAGLGTCSASSAQAIDPPFSYDLVPTLWDLFATGPTFTCSPGPSIDPDPGANDPITWAATTLQVTGAPGGTLWAVDAAKLPGAITGCPAATYGPVAVNIDASRAGAIALPAGSWYIYRTSGAATDACLGNSAGNNPLNVDHGEPTVLAWTSPSATVTVTGAPAKSSKRSMVYSSSSTAPSCSRTSPGSGIEMTWASSAYSKILPPGTYKFYSWNKEGGLPSSYVRCVLGGTVIVGGSTTYTLPFNTVTKPVVGP